MNRIFIFFVLFWESLSLQIFAQSPSFSHLGTENGLSNNLVRTMALDPQGHIWIGTMAGLNRFDGNRFQHFNANNSEIGNEAIYALYVNEANGELWIGNAEDGIKVLNMETSDIKSITEADGLKISSVVHFSESSQNGIWIVPYHGEMLHYDRKDRSFSTLLHLGVNLEDYGRWCALDDMNGHLIVGYATRGLAIVDLKSKEVCYLQNDPNDSSSLPSNRVLCLSRDSRGNLWVGTSKGLALFHPRSKTFTVFRHIPNNPQSIVADHIYSIIETNDGKLMVASDVGGVSIMDLNQLTLNNKDNVVFQNLTIEDGLSSRNIRSLLHDDYGNIWIGNFSNGIDICSQHSQFFHQIPYYRYANGHVAYKPVWGLFNTRTGEILAGGENEIISIKDCQIQKIYSFDGKFHRPYTYPLCFTVDSNNRLLIGTFDDGLYRFSPEMTGVEGVKADEPDIDIMTFHHDADSIWIGTEYGIYTYKDGRLKKQEKINKQLDDKGVFSIHRDSQDNLWVATYAGGVAIFNKDLDLIKTLSSTNLKKTHGLFFDSQGSVWIASRLGLGYIKNPAEPDSVELFGKAQGLSDLFVRSICEDKEGNIWISTNNTIAMWDKVDRHFIQYDYRDGLPRGNFIENSAIVADDGTLYFGSLSGLCYFNPKDLNKVHELPKVVITSYSFYDGHPNDLNNDIFIPGNSLIELKSEQNTIRISFGIANYAIRDMVEYAYQVEGLNMGWTNTNGEHEVILRDLRPGIYTFKVKARLRNGEWSDDNLSSIKVCILPPWYLTWYAKLFYWLFLAALIWYISNFYIRRLKLKNTLLLEKEQREKDNELNNERLRFYTNITHELRTPLTLILGPLEDLVKDRNLPKTYSQKIGLIHGSAEKLLGLVNDLLEFRKTETHNRHLCVARGDLSATIKEIGLRFRELNRNDKIDVILDMGSEISPVYFDAEVVRTIVNNLMSNALKYTQEGQVVLSLKEVGDFVQIMVRDTGYGIADEALPHIFERFYQSEENRHVSGTGIGLSLVKSLAELHEGNIIVESKLGEGSLFAFSISKSNSYPDALHREETVDKKDIQLIADNSKESNDNLKILVVEDNDDIREYVSACFTDSSQVIKAKNGEEGLALAKEYIPDLIVSDIMMPIMDGIQLCRTVKENIATSHIPVILLTAKDSLQDRETGYDCGADSYLTKPFTAKLLLSRVNNILGNRRRMAELLSKGITTSIVGTSKLLEKEDKYSGLNRLDRKFLEDLEETVMNNLNKDSFDVPKLASMMNMSHSTLYRKIRNLLGITGNEYIRKVRLNKAYQMLTSKEFNISEVAYQCGFNDVSYFRKCFKEEFGVLPSELI